MAGRGREQTRQIELAVAERPSVGHAVRQQVVVLGRERTVGQLQPHDMRPETLREIGQGPTAAVDMPDVHAHPAARTTGRRDQRRRRGRVRQVRERQELKPDHDTLAHARRPVAERGEAGDRVVPPALVGTDGPHVGHP